MAKIFNPIKKLIKRIKRNFYTNRLNKLLIKKELDINYISVLESTIKENYDKRYAKKLLKVKKKLYPYELKATPLPSYYQSLQEEKRKAFEEKMKWKRKALKQTYKRKAKRDDALALKWYQESEAKLDKKEKTFEIKLQKKYPINIEPQKGLEEKIALYKGKLKEEQLGLEEWSKNRKEHDSSFFKKQEEKTKEKIKKLTLKIQSIEPFVKDLINSEVNVEMNKNVLLKVDHLSMYFGGLKAVDDLSFEVKEGEIFGLIGPNGAGKTTVFNCITQFYKSNRGDIWYRDKNQDIINLNTKKVHNVIKYGIVRTFQNVELIWELSILDNMLVAAHTMYHSNLFTQFLHLKRLKHEEKVIRATALKVLEKLGLLPFKDFLPLGLPYGILKRIELARTLMTNPRLIILDEPAAGLNEKETEDLAKLIKQVQKEFNCTIFLVEHDMSLVMDLCDTVCAISFGKKLAIGKPAEIQASKVVQEAYLGGE